MTEKKHHITDNPDHSRFDEIFGDTPEEGTAEHAMYISRLMADDRREREEAQLQRQREIAQKIARLESEGYRKVSDSELKKLGFKYRCFVDEVSGYDDWYWAAPDGWDVKEIDGKVWVRNNSPKPQPKAQPQSQPQRSPSPATNSRPRRRPVPPKIRRDELGPVLKKYRRDTSNVKVTPKKIDTSKIKVTPKKIDTSKERTGGHNEVS